jgi:hypothetical protein
MLPRTPSFCSELRRSYPVRIHFPRASVAGRQRLRWRGRFVIMAALTLLGCDRGGPGHEAGAVRDPYTLAGRGPVPLSGAAVVSNLVIGAPNYMATQGRTLWVTDRIGDPFVHVIDLTRDHLVVSYGRTGEGPGDLHALANLALRPDDTSAVWGFDPSLHRLNRFGNHVGPEKPIIVAPPSGGFVGRMIWLTHDRLLALGDEDTNRYVIGDSLGHRQARIAGTLLGPDSVSYEIRRDASGGVSVCATSKLQRFAVLFIHGGRIDVLDFDATVVARAKVPFPSNGDFRRDSAGRWHTRTGLRHYEACSATPSRLYALYSGLREDRQGGARTVEAQYVHVFDWSGSLTSVIRLDRPMSAMTTSGDTILYAAASDGSGVYRYRLPGSPSSADASARPKQQ